MSKPYGISLDLIDGLPAYRVRAPSGPEDAIWSAVEAAISFGWDARRFRMEAAQAWEHEMKERGKAAREELERAP